MMVNDHNILIIIIVCINDGDDHDIYNDDRYSCGEHEVEGVESQGDGKIAQH